MHVQDREAFAQRVQDVSATDLANMGFTIISFTIKDVHDKQGYLEATVEFALRRSDLRAPFLAYLEDIVRRESE